MSLQSTVDSAFGSALFVKVPCTNFYMKWLSSTQLHWGEPHGSGSSAF